MSRTALRLLLTTLSISFLMAGCSEEEPPPAAEGASSGGLANMNGAAIPSTGAEAVEPGALAAPGTADPTKTAAPKTPATDEPPAEVAPPPLDDALRASLRAGAPSEDRYHGAPRYTLDVEVDDDLMAYFGTEELIVTNRTAAPLERIALFLYPNAPELTTAGSRNLKVRDVRVDGEPAKTTDGGHVFEIVLAKPLAPAETAKVSMSFRGVVPRLPEQASDMNKLAIEQLVSMVTGGTDHKHGYGIFSYGDGIISMALWYPILMVDDPSHSLVDPDGSATQGDVSHFEVAHYDVTVRAPADQVVIATGVEASTTTADGLTVRRFAAAAVREFTVQLSQQYLRAETRVGDVNVRSWYLPEHRKDGELVLTAGAKALEFFNTEFGPYPYAELDLVEAPLVGGAGGVEFPGLVTIAKMFYGGGERADGKGDEGFLPAGMGDIPFIAETREFVVAHEVAHQWWNAVVGSDSRRHPWVDEAMANMAAILYFEHVHGKAAGDRQRELQLRLNYQIALMGGANDRPVDLPADQYNGMLEYAAMVYGKGALFLDALRDDVGPANFRRGLQRYYADFAFRIAGPDDLIAAVTRDAPDPAASKRLAERWLHGSHGVADIGPMDFGSVVQMLLGSGALGSQVDEVVAMLDADGVAELGKLLDVMLDPNGALSDDIDYAAIVGVIGKVLGADVDELAPVLDATQRLMKGDVASDEEALRLMLEGTRALAGDDADVNMALDAADLMLRLMERADP